jgi:hypothetical protein
VVATDGQRLTLGETTLTLHLTPGHTLGTISTLIPVRDGERRHIAAHWGGTAFNWVRNRAGYITPERSDRFWFDQYISPARRFRGSRPRPTPTSSCRITPISTARSRSWRRRLGAGPVTPIHPSLVQRPSRAS